MGRATPVQPQALQTLGGPTGRVSQDQSPDHGSPMGRCAQYMAGLAQGLKLEQYLGTSCKASGGAGLTHNLGLAQGCSPSRQASERADEVGGGVS